MKERIFKCIKQRNFRVGERVAVKECNKKFYTIDNTNVRIGVYDYTIIGDWNPFDSRYWIEETDVEFEF